ncbi:unnamed protein product, partial [Ixodes hexagonus]
LAGDCDGLDTKVEEKLNHLFSHLPENYAVTLGGMIDIPRRMFSLGNATVSGLNNLQPASKYQMFCKDNETQIIANLRATFIEVSYPWTFCSEDNGTLSTESSLVGLEVVFIVEQTGDDSKLKVSRVTPLILEGILVHLYGAGAVVGTVFSALGHIFPSPFRMYWSHVMPEIVKKALIDNLEQLQ